MAEFYQVPDDESKLADPWMGNASAQHVEQARRRTRSASHCVEVPFPPKVHHKPAQGRAQRREPRSVALGLRTSRRRMMHRRVTLNRSRGWLPSAPFRWKWSLAHET